MAYAFNDDKSKHKFLSNVKEIAKNQSIDAYSSVNHTFNNLEQKNYLLFIYVDSNASEYFRVSVNYKTDSSNTKWSDYDPSYLQFKNQSAAVPIVLIGVTDVDIEIYNASNSNGYFQVRYKFIEI